MEIDPALGPLALGALLRCLDRTRHLVLVVVDPEFRIVACSASLERLVGRDAPLVGYPLGRLLEGGHEAISVDGKDGAPVRCDVLAADGLRVPVNWFFERGAEVSILVGDLAVAPNDDVLRQMSRLSNELLDMNRELQRKNAALEEAQSTVKVLSGVVPICAYCREIRDDQGFWRRVEEYLMTHSDLVLSHGICPKCQAEHFPRHRKG